MTKKEMFSQAMAILNDAQASDELKAKFTELLAPKKAGLQVDVEAIVRRDPDTNDIVEIQDRLSGYWFPATLKYFFKDSKDTKIVNANGDKLYPVARAADKLKKQAKKTAAASKAAILQDVLDEKLDPTEAKEAIAALTDEPDYSILDNN